MNCSLCGWCKTSCPIFSIALSEHNSSRGWALLRKRGILHEVFYRCLLCRGCMEACPGKVDLEFIGIRPDLVKSKIETEENKRMIENFKKYGTPYPDNELPKVIYSL